MQKRLYDIPEKVDYNIVFNAVREKKQDPPKGGGPFELYMPHKLESLFWEVGLTNLDSGEANCPFHYDDFESFWYGNVSAGPFQGVLQKVDEIELKLAVKTAVNSFFLDDGSLHIPQNTFKYVSAKAH